MRLFNTKKFSPILLSLLLTLSALGAVVPLVFAEAIVAIEPVTTVADPPASFSINVTIQAVASLQSYELKIGFDRNVLIPTNAEEGPFLPSNPDGVPTDFRWSYTYPQDFIVISSIITGIPPGASGSGTLAIVYFKVQAPGTSDLHIYDSGLTSDFDNGGAPIPHTTSDGFFHTTLPVPSFKFTPSTFGRPIVGENVTFDATDSYDPDETNSIVSYNWNFGDNTTGTGPVVKHVYTKPTTLTDPIYVILNVTDDETTSWATNRTIHIHLHDITVAAITGPDEIFVRRTAEFNVTVVNNGSHPDSFNTTLYYNSNPIGTQSSEIDRGKNATLTFRWNTFINQTTLDPAGTPFVAWNYPLNATTSNDIYTYSSINATLQEFIGYNTTTTGWAGISRVEVGIEAKTETGGDDQVSIQVKTGKTWSPEYIVNITSTDDTFRWIDVTGTLSWLPAMVEEGQVRARIKYIQVGDTATTIYVDWLPIRITPTNPTDIPEGVYSIWANAFLVDHATLAFVPIYEETNPTDNTLLGKPITLTFVPNHDVAATIEEVDPTRVKIGIPSTVTAKIENLGNVDEIVNVFVYRNGTQVATQTNLRLTAGNFRRVTLPWFTASNTTVEGNYNLTVYVEPVPGEVFTTDNMQNVTVLMKLLPFPFFTFSPASPQISEAVQFDASPSYVPGEPAGLITDYLWDFGDGVTGAGTTVTHAYTQPGAWSVSLTVVDDEDLNNTGIRVIQIPKLASVITIVSSVSPVPLGLNTTVSGAISPVRANVNVIINSTRFDGNVTTTVASLTSNPQGQYSFVWVPEAIGVYGFMAFWFGDTVTAEAESSMLNVTVVLRDLVLVKVDLSEILVAPGGSVQIDVTAMNRGTETVNFNVNVYHNDTLLETKPVNGLVAGGSRKLNFEWDTTDTAEGVYLIKATVDTLQGEASVADNSVTTGIVLGSAGGVSGLNVFMYSTVALIVVIAAMAVYMFRTMRGKGKEPGQEQVS